MRGGRVIVHLAESLLAGDQIARGHRPRNAAVARKFADQFGRLQLFTIERNFGGWAHAQKVHFADGGVFDQIMAEDRR